MKNKHFEHCDIKGYELTCTICGGKEFNSIQNCIDCIYHKAKQEAVRLQIQLGMTSETARKIEQNKIASFAWGSNRYQGD